MARGASPRPSEGGCVICRGPEGDAELGRFLVWEDARWRLKTSRCASVVGFSYLEPRRHIPYLADLDGDEATTLGPTLAWAARLLRDVTGAESVWALVFGEHVPHRHVNLAPRRPGDALLADPVLVDASAPKPTRAHHEAVVKRLRAAASAR
jgi:diadenosine tetraphosphate (Ap4A) HIT family hydrolase